jgi:hypothetical protein
VKLLGEEIYPEVSMLAGLSGSGDANDLAGATLKHQKIPYADMMAWDRDGVGSSATLHQANALTNTITDAGGTALVVVHNDLLTVVTMERMEDTVGRFLQSMTDGVIMAFVVEVSHLRLI